MNQPNTDTPFLARITVYPIKSLDGVNVTTARILASGALEHDRSFAMVDKKGRFVNGKRTPQIHLLRTTFSRDWHTVTLQVQDTDKRRSFHLYKDRQALEDWLSAFLGFAITLEHDPRSGFPDDTDASGPTVISTATLEEVSSWFVGGQADDMRTRFRANLEIAGVPPFWEDQLFDAPHTIVEFSIGEVRFHGVNPCQRCVVPTRHPLTGEAYPAFTTIFTTRRQTTLPSWTSVAHFDHFYRLSVNTHLPSSEANKVLRLGDTITIKGIRPLY